MPRILACLILLVSPVLAAESPGDAAIGFLKQLAELGPDPLEGVAIDEGTTPEKLDSIRSRLRRLAPSLTDGRFHVIKSEERGDLAAVLVSQVIDLDPARVQVHAVALLRRDGQWRPAPVPASFENTGITYLPEFTEPAAALETWMLEGRVTEFARLSEDVNRSLLADVRKAVARDTLMESGPAAIATLFIDACRRRDLPAALACVGGLDDPLPASWDHDLRVLTAAFRNPDKMPGDWETITLPGRALAVVDSDILDDSATVSFGHFDPANVRRSRLDVSILHFPLARPRSGLWRVELPSWLLADNQLDDGNPMDEGLVERFPAALLASHPPVQLKDPDAFARSFAGALRKADFPALLSHFEPDKPLADLIQNAASLFRIFEDPPKTLPLILDSHTVGDEGALLVATFASRSPEISPADLDVIPLRRGESGWLATTSRPEAPALDTWRKEMLALSRADWLRRSGSVHAAGDIPDGPAADEATLTKIAESFLSAVRAHDPAAVLDASVSFEAPGDPEAGRTLLRALGHEMTSTAVPDLQAIHREGRWAAAAVRFDPVSDREPPYLLLYPILNTPGGPRVLADCALYDSDTRTRTYLNNVVWKRLAKRFPETDLAELRSIYDKQRALSAP